MPAPKKRKTKIKKINLALQGGGAHGGFAWGALDLLLADPRIEIDSISATSAGSINAVVIAQGLINGGKEGARKALAKFWKDVSDYGKLYSPIRKTLMESFFGGTVERSYSYQAFELMTELMSPYQFNPFNYNPLRELLEKNVNFEEVQKFQKVKLFICATNVQTGKVKIFTNEDTCIDSILASTCLPYIFQAVPLDGEYYWDGGYMGNPAIFPLIYGSDVSDVLIIHINPIVRDEVPKTVDEILNRINEISFNSSLMREMRAIAFVTDLIDKKWIKEEYLKSLKKMYIHSIRSDKAMAAFSLASKFDTDEKFIQKLFHLGRKVAKKWLDQNFEKIGKSSSTDLQQFL